MSETTKPRVPAGTWPRWFKRNVRRRTPPAFDTRQAYLETLLPRAKAEVDPHLKLGTFCAQDSAWRGRTARGTPRKRAIARRPHRSTPRTVARIIRHLDLLLTAAAALETDVHALLKE